MGGNGWLTGKLWQAVDRARGVLSITERTHTIFLLKQQSSPHSTIRRVPGSLTAFTAVITTIISISASLVPAASAPKSLLVGLWPDANAIALEQKPEWKKETIGFWPATLILGLMTMSVPQQAPSLSDLGFVMLSYLGEPEVL